MKMSNQLTISLRKKQLQEEYEHLQAVYSNLIAVRDEMVQVEAPRLEALYMETLGQLQYEVLSLEYDIALLKLERDLLQAYVNRGEKPDIEEVDEEVSKAAGAYNETLHEEEEKIKEAKAYLEYHSEEDKEKEELKKRELKVLYKRMVQMLHPDLHPEQTEWEKELFLKVQDAYREGNLERLRQLAEELNTGVPSAMVDSETVEEWEERVRKLKEQIIVLRQEIEDRKSSFPFTYKEKLNDKELMSAMQEQLRARTEILKREKERLAKIVKMMKGKKHGTRHCKNQS